MTLVACKEYPSRRITKPRRYHSNASTWRYWKLDYAVANDVNQAKFEKLNYKKKE